MTYPVEDGVDGLTPALEDLCMKAAQAASHGYTLLVLSDKTAGPNRVPIRYVKHHVHLLILCAALRT